MRKEVYAFTVGCVVEGDDKADAWRAALAYLAEHAQRGDLEYGEAELLEVIDA